MIYKIIFEERLFNERHGIREGFSYYDKTQWLPEKNFFENNFRVFCRKHNIVISDKKLYDLCSCKNKKYHYLSEGGHSHLRVNQVEEYDQLVIDFIGK